MTLVLPREASAQQSSLEQAELGHLVHWIGVNSDASVLYQRSPEAGVLYEAKRDGLKDFDDTPSADVRESRWGAQGTELAKVQGYLASQSSLWVNAKSANDAYQQVSRLVGSGRRRVFLASPLAVKARNALGGGLVSDVDDRQQPAQRTAKTLQMVSAVQLTSQVF